jgi:hypothetical protein
VRPKPYRRNRFGNRLVRAFVWVVLTIFILTSVGAILIVTVH